jgi:hypothetical protein
MLRRIPEDFEEKLIDILYNLDCGKISAITASKEIRELLKLTKETALNGGDLADYNNEYRSDCEIIQRVLITNGYLNTGLNDALRLWSEYSDSYCAGWLVLPDNDEDIFNSIKRYI